MVAVVIARSIASEAKWNAMHAARSGTFLAQKRSDGAKKTRATHAVEDTSEDYDVFALHNSATVEAREIKAGVDRSEACFFGGGRFLNFLHQSVP